MKKWLALLYVLWLASTIFLMVSYVVNNNRIEEQSKACQKTLEKK